MKEIVNILFGVFSAIICTIFLDLYYAKLSNIKLKITFKNVLLIIVASIITLCINSYLSTSLKAIIALFNVCIHYKLLFKEKNKKIITSYVLIFLLLVILEIIFTSILSLSGVLELNRSSHSIEMFNLCLSIAIQIIEYLIITINYIKIRMQKVINFFVNLDPAYLIYILFISCFPLGMLNLEKNYSYETNIWLLILTLMFLILFGIIISLKMQKYMLKNTNKSLIEYNNKYSNFLDEYRIYKHNINNKLIALKSYGNEKINSLIDDLLEEETDFNIKNNNLYNIPNGIKGIVAEKLYNVSVNVLINNKMSKDPFINLTPKKFNSISESLGVCLDNALEASCETNNPIIIMDLYEDVESIYIKIGNNFCNSIDLEEIGNKFYSTKSRGSGLGLFSIMQNKLVREKIDIINDFYYIELQIKKANS